MGNASLSPSLFTRWERIFPVYISIGTTLLHPHFLMEEFSAMKRGSVSIVISIGRLVCCGSICGEGCACRGGCGVGVRPTPAASVYGRVSIKFTRPRTVHVSSRYRKQRRKKRGRGWRSLFSRILSHPRNPTVTLIRTRFAFLPSSVHQIYFLPPSCRPRTDQVLEVCLLGRRTAPPSAALERGQKRRRRSTSPGSACSSSAKPISSTRYEATTGSVNLYFIAQIVLRSLVDFIE
jgi:hypothetical protein